MQVILISIVCFFLHLSASSPLLHRDDILHRRAQTDTSTRREVSIGLERTYFAQANEFFPDNGRIRGFHASILVQENYLNGALRIEITTVPGVGGANPLAVLVTEFPMGMSPSNIRVLSERSQLRMVPLEGQAVELNNYELLDYENGRGVVSDVWGEDTTYHIQNNNNNDFLGKLAQRLNLVLPPEVATAFGPGGPGYATTFNLPPAEEDVPVRYRQLSIRDGYQVRGEWDVADPANPRTYVPPVRAPAPNPNLLNPDVLAADLAANVRAIALDPVNYFQAEPVAPMRSPFDFDPAEVEEAAPNQHLDEEPCGRRKRACVPRNSVQDGSIKTDLVITRSSGQIAMLGSFALEVLKGLNVVAAVVAPAFILLDLVEGKFTAAAFGIAGLAAGIALAIAVSGPIGFFIGAAVGVLFAILPGLFSQKTPPPSNNLQQIIQWSFFGDKGHTGNEKCNADRKAANLTPNCTAVYGPGVISKVFGWEIFDATAFLVAYNGGYSMSIPDIASAFQVYDYSVSSWGSNVTAVIDCGRGPNRKRDVETSPIPNSALTLDSGPMDSFDPLAISRETLNRRQIGIGHSIIPGPKGTVPTGPQPPPSQGYDCPKPSYSLKRNLVNIPMLNLTAEALHSQIIPAAGGTCKIISQPLNGVYDELFNSTITGLPVSFVCNLTEESYSDVTLPALINYNETTISNATGSVNSSYSAALIQQWTDFRANSTFNGTDVYGQNATFFLGANNTYPNTTRVSRTNSTSFKNSTIQTPPLTSGQNSTIVGTSSNGAVGAGYEPAAPPVPFAPLTEANSTCFGKPGNILCLPGGNYSTQHGSLGFSSKGASVLSVPGAPLPGGISWDTLEVVDRLGWYTNWTRAGLYGNITAGSDSSNALIAGTNSFSVNSWPFRIEPTRVRCACLYTETSFKGDVACFGPGGGNLTGPITGLAKSIMLRGVSVWIYADHYNDLGGAYISTDVEDLKLEAYGTSDSFSGKVKAMWIRPLGNI